METNEVQWHPPEQFLSATPDTQTGGDDNVPGYEGREEGAQDYQEEKHQKDQPKGDFV